MIVNKEGTVIVFTPTKTATKSIESEVKADKECRHLVVMPRHGWTLPKGLTFPNNPEKGHILIRNPYARLVSMYQFGLHTKHSTLLKMGEDGFESFCFEWARRRTLKKDPFWTMTYTDYYKAALRIVPQCKIHVLEANGLRALLKAIGIEKKKTEGVKHVNAVHQHFDRKPAWTKRALDAVEEHLQYDVKMGSYAVPDLTSKKPPA